MGSKLFVGGLSWGTTDEILKNTFSSYGRIVESRVIFDRDTGKSRGFGFVTFSSEDDAKAALIMNGSSLDGRTIRVNLAEDKAAGSSAPRPAPPVQDRNTYSDRNTYEDRTYRGSTRAPSIKSAGIDSPMFTDFVDNTRRRKTKHRNKDRFEDDFEDMPRSRSSKKSHRYDDWD